MQRAEHLRPLPTHEKNNSSISLISEDPAIRSGALRDRSIVPDPSLQQQISRVTLTSIALYLLCFVLSYIANDRYANSLDYAEDTATDLMRGMLLLLALIQIVVVIRYYALRLKLGVQLGEYQRGTQLPDTKLVYWLAAEIFVHCLTLPPRINSETSVYMLGTRSLLSLSDISFLCFFLRTYHLPRAYYWKCRFSSPKAFFYSRLESVQNHCAWVARSLLCESPTFVLLSSWLLLGFVGGVSMRVLDYSVPGNKVNSVWSAFWGVVVPEATIGYGDIVPLTHLSRAVIVFIVFGGITVYSFAVLFTRQIMEFSVRESRLFSQLTYREGRKEFRECAATLIQRYWKFHASKHSGGRILLLLYKFNRQHRTFKAKRSRLVSLTTPLFIDCLRHFELNIYATLQVENTRLRKLRLIQTMVSCMQSQEINRVEYSNRMKLKSIAHCAKSCAVFRSLRKDSSRTSSGRVSIDEFISRRSLKSQNSLTGAKRLFRARDSAFKKLRGMRANLQLPGSVTPRSGSNTSDNQTKRSSFRALES